MAHISIRALLNFKSFRIPLYIQVVAQENKINNQGFGQSKTRAMFIRNLDRFEYRYKAHLYFRYDYYDALRTTTISIHFGLKYVSGMSIVH